MLFIIGLCFAKLLDDIIYLLVSIYYISVSIYLLYSLIFLHIYLLFMIWNSWKNVKNA